MSIYGQRRSHSNPADICKSSGFSIGYPAGHETSIFGINFKKFFQQAKWISMLSLVLQGVGVGARIVYFWKKSRLLLLSMAK